MRAELWRLRGVLLVAALAAATLWLGAAGKLVLYIHPRYEAFTILLAALALAGCAAAVAASAARLRSGRGGEAAGAAAHGHAAHSDHAHSDHDAPPRSTGGRLLAALALLLSAAVAVAAVVLPPATLTSATAAQRDIAAGGLELVAVSGPDALEAAQNGDAALFASFTVRDWAVLLYQSSDPAFYAGKPVDVVGFVTPHPDDPGLYYVSRFAITCCAVDAVPFGVPVAVAAGQAPPEPDSWVRVTGGFVAGGDGVVLEPAEVTVVDEPAEPYLY